MLPSRDLPDSRSGSATPKIAIKGFSLSSKSNGAKSKPQLSSNLGKRPRSTFAHGDDSDEERPVRHEAVTAFGSNGAEREDKRKARGPLVIERLGNTRPGVDGEVRRVRGAGMKNLLPQEVMDARDRARNGAPDTEKEVLNAPDEEVVWGLTVRKRVKVEDAEVNEVKTEVVVQSANVQAPEETDVPKTADEEALAALLGQETKKKGPDMVIESLSTTTRPEPISEEDAYRRAIAAAPGVSTLEDYDRVPVEEFGAALLRGMGWNGEKTGKVRDVKRRQNLLGLGAKQLKDAEELGAWVQKSDTKRLKPGVGGSGNGGGRHEQKVRVSDYRREEELKRERREERGGGSYRKERERDRDYDRRRDDDHRRDYDRRR